MMATITDSRRILEELEPRRRSVQQRLTALGRRIRSQLLLEGLAWTVAAVVGLFVATLLVDRLFRPALAMRLVLLSLGACGAAAIAYRRLVPAWQLKMNPLELATVLERRHPGLAQKVATVLELPELLDEEPSGRGSQSSPSMVRAAVLVDASHLEQMDFALSLDLRRRTRFAALLAGALLLPALVFGLSPATGRIWTMRWLLGSNVRWPQHTYLSIVGAEQGILTVPRGDPLTVQVEAQPGFDAPQGELWRLPGRHETWLLHLGEMPASQLPDEVSVAYRAAGGSLEHDHFTRFDGSRFRFEFPPVLEPVEFHVAGGDDWFGPLFIRPIDRPSLESLKIRAHRASRPAAEVETYDLVDAQPMFLLGTQLELQIVARDPISGVSVEQPSIDPKLGRQSLAVERLTLRSYAVRWTMQHSLSLQVQLIGTEGGVRSRPYDVSLGLLKDRAPRVTLQVSGLGRRITPQASMPLEMRAADDFGLLKLGLEMEQVLPTEGPPQTSSRRFEVPSPPQTSAGEPPLEAEHKQTLALAPLAIVPGTTLKLRGAAEDNCDQGNQTGVSRWLTFQVVTPEVLFYEILMRQRAQRARFRQALDLSKAQHEALRSAAGAPQIAAVARKQQLVARQVADIGRQLALTLEEMKLNELGSSQGRELLQTRVLDPLAHLHTDTFARLQAALNEAGASAAGFRRQSAAASQLQQQALTEMEVILKHMSQWESFVDVVNQLREIIKLQSGVLESTEQERKKKTNDLFDD